jgi:antitoxin ParD1/3/4
LQALHVSLTDQLEKMLKAKIASGMYNNASEVIRESLRFMETHEVWIYQIKLEKLRSEVSKGLDRLDLGESVDGRSFFEELNKE